MKKLIIVYLLVGLLFGCTLKTEDSITDPVEELKNHCKIVEEKDKNIYFVENCATYDLEYAFINFNTSEVFLAGNTLNFKDLTLNYYRDQEDPACTIYYDKNSDEIKSDKCSDLRENFAFCLTFSRVLYHLNSNYDFDSSSPESFKEFDDFDFKTLLPYIEEVIQYTDRNYEIDSTKKSDEYLEHMWRRYCSSEYREEGKCVVH